MKNCFAHDIVAELHANPPLSRKKAYDVVVRAIDILIVVPSLVVIAPLMAVIAMAIKIDDGGPVFFRQERLGKGGLAFRIIKFRSMVMNAEQVGAKLRIAKGDIRITRVGKVLREYHLDELPQLFNVLIGVMTLVGPRPALVFQRDYYEDWEMPRLAVRPGITGLSQVSGGNVLDWDKRILIDVYFVRHRNFVMYLHVLIKTGMQIFAKKGIYTRDGSVKGWSRPVPNSHGDVDEAPPVAQAVTTDA